MGNEQAKDRVIEILYRNHRGEIAMRRIEPVAMRFEATKWHPEPQWIIDAWDVDKQARRSFAFKDILPIDKQFAGPISEPLEKESGE